MEWRDLAACSGEDTSFFFPVSNQSDLRAKAICERCSVKGQCLDVALRSDEVGVWGGTNERQRKRIKNRYIRPHISRAALDLLSQG
jgi:WhiB family redox-sensing transcriptional regulator